MSDNKALIDKIIDSETPNDNPNTPQDERAIITNRPSDRGGRTQWGISEKSNPDLWADNVVTEEEARKRYEEKYVKAPGFDQITDSQLKAQLVDFGVTSGPQMAIQKLQECLRVEVDGQLGPKTLAAANAQDPKRLSNQLALARIKMIGRLVNRDPKQASNLNGWINRSAEFFRF